MATTVIYLARLRIARGNPLFVGETVRAFLEDGTLAWRDGMVALSASSGTRLPITLRAILGARIDALPSGARDALGVASVIGISFRLSTVEALLDDPLAADAFEQLAASALVTPHDGDRWRFAHALIHDAAYAGLLASRRRVLHERLADRLERGPEPSTLSQIAAHRVAAGDVSRAIPLLREAAESALALGAVAEAAASWRQAADLAAAADPAGAEIDRARAAEAVSHSTRFASSSDRPRRRQRRKRRPSVRPRRGRPKALAVRSRSAAGRTVTVSPSTAVPDPRAGGLAQLVHLGLPCGTVVDEDRRSCAGAARELDRLLGGEMATLGIVMGGQTEGALDQQQIGVADTPPRPRPTDPCRRYRRGERRRAPR